MKVVFVVFTHGNLGVELVNSAEIIAGKQEAIMVEAVTCGDSPETVAVRVEQLLSILDTEDDVLFFVDMRGGTPWNTVMRFMNKGRNFCLAGVNLPMLLEAIISRNNGASVKEILESAVSAGRNGIVLAEVSPNK